MTLKNAYIFLLYRWLDVPLHGDLLRSRNKFIRLIEPQYNAINAKRTEILSDLAEKDKDGKAIIEGGTYKIPDDKKQDFIDQFTDGYLEEDYEFDVTKQIKSDVKEILMTKLTKGLGIEDGKVFEEIIDVL